MRACARACSRVHVHWLACAYARVLLDDYIGIHILHACSYTHARTPLLPSPRTRIRTQTKIDEDGREMEERGEGSGEVRSRRDVRLAAHALDFSRRQTPRHQHSCHATAYISAHPASSPSFTRRRLHRSIARRVLASSHGKARDKEEAGGTRGVAAAHAHWRTAATRRNDGRRGIAPRACSRSERAGLGVSCKSKHPHPALTSACTSDSSTAPASTRSYSCSSSPVSMVVVTALSAPSAPGPHTAARLERRRAPVASTANRTLRSAGPSGWRQAVVKSDARACVRPCARPSACVPPLAPDVSWFRLLCMPASAARGWRERKRRRRRCGASDTASTTPGSATDCAASRPGANTVTTCPGPRGSSASCCDA